MKYGRKERGTIRDGGGGKWPKKDLTSAKDTTIFRTI